MTVTGRRLSGWFDLDGWRRYAEHRGDERGLPVVVVEYRRTREGGHMVGGG